MKGFKATQLKIFQNQTQKQIRILINRSHEKKRHIHGSGSGENFGFRAILIRLLF